ncbi:DUF732 domain-containing protein [Streptomyces sp. NPDC056682]|uniref:DUF732 domain-containing protein n=1 Tax=Streptomyces sp. NPDC056682 TaxID=3345909 RepID=UPI00367DE371
MNHTRTATVVVLAAAGLLLAGCSSSPPTVDGRPATRAANPGTGTATITASTDDDAYVQHARNRDPGDFNKTDPSIITPEGHTVCSMLAAGQTVETAAARVRQDFQETATRALVAAAPALCPDQTSKINAWISELH